LAPRWLSTVWMQRSSFGWLPIERGRALGQRLGCAAELGGRFRSSLWLTSGSAQSLGALYRQGRGALRWRTVTNQIWAAKSMPKTTNSERNEPHSYQVERIKQEGDKFYLIWPEPECTNVCFWYVPRRLRGQPRTKEWENELGMVSVGCSRALSLRSPHQMIERH